MSYENQGARTEQKAFALMMQFILIGGLIFIAWLLAGAMYLPIIIEVFKNLIK